MEDKSIVELMAEFSQAGGMTILGAMWLAICFFMRDMVARIRKDMDELKNSMARIHERVDAVSNSVSALQGAHDKRTGPGG